MSQPLSKARFKGLCSLHRKKFRRLDGAFLIEGHKLVEEALKCRFPLKGIVGLREVLRAPKYRQFTESVRKAGVELFEMTPRQLELIATTETPQPVLAVGVIQRRKFDPEKVRRMVILCDVQDPGNVGTAIRTAWCFGYTDVMLAGDCADVYSPKVVRGSMGGVFHVRLHQAKRPLGAIEKVNKGAIAVLGTAAGGRDFTTVAVGGPVALVMGNESQGLSEDVLDKCHEVIGIPIEKTAESLNVSVAGGILMQYYSRPVQTLSGRSIQKVLITK